MAPNNSKNTNDRGGRIPQTSHIEHKSKQLIGGINPANIKSS